MDANSKNNHNFVYSLENAYLNIEIFKKVAFLNPGCLEIGIFRKLVRIKSSSFPVIHPAFLFPAKSVIGFHFLTAGMNCRDVSTCCWESICFN